MKHICQESKSCCCSLQALEPDEDCPVHSAGPWPPRCGQCGKFIKWPNRHPSESLITKLALMYWGASEEERASIQARIDMVLDKGLEPAP